ncbi:MAG TPA: GH116 family glycosyl hydrolase [Candidatus Aminicenantes bacterium]|nr:GH116 family glycosyl hydrolase [Candidatus Aminicenantes bacterium]HRY63938.1 GH116 family glycosyl hydrolase [Candidatus Aminicenantes bacterium]HRZ70851.1 GH116 family glycosyl hydrolase [Candidatus Aminicenantes bacterium]
MTSPVLTPRAPARFPILFLALCLIMPFAAGGQSPASPQPYGRDELARSGPVRTFEGRALGEVAFPLGGVGTGTISLGGRGNLRDWEIFNRPGKGVHMPFTFFALYCEQSGRKTVRVLEGPLEPPFTTGFGFRRVHVPGLPRMEKARFKGEYPYAAVELSDSRVPLEITLEAFNPLVPLEPDDSGIPAFVLRYRVKNTGAATAKVTVAGSFINPVGYDGVGMVDGLGNDKFGQNVNEYKATAALRGLALSSRKVGAGEPAYGTMALTTPWPDVTYLTHWVRGEWWDDLQIFWDDFGDDGRLRDLAEVSPSPDKQTDVGTLGLMATIAPGQEVVLPFIVSWHFPNVLNYFDIVPGQRGRLFKNYYASRHADAWAAAEYLQANLDRLEKPSRAFHDAFFGTTLPPYVLDAVSSQAAIIRTTTGFRLADGNYYGFEGCGDQGGCCPLNCAHVWNYAQSLAFLFPSLERTMRETDFLVNLKPDGAMIFRTSLPLAGGVLWDFKPAADGQLGRIISLYRDWQISGDTAWLKKLWPQAKKALDYAWKGWDADRDGLLEGEQHNTYDIEFYGPNSMLSGFYLGALQAGMAMAMAAGDVPSAKTYRLMYLKAQTAYDAALWNGEYYVQRYDKVMEKKYQYGEGCLSDMLLGQWLGMIAGLDRYLPADRIRSSLGAIYKYNFRPDFRDFSNVQRTYALNDEKGLLLCSWPKGGRPPLPFPYSDEVWTGIEYQVASHLIYEGLLDEGLSVVKAVRDRYDGLRRNPWDEVECGHHYARAMSSWGLLLALSGQAYSAPEKRMGFDPKMNADDFRTVWTAGSGWGTYSQRAGSAGRLALRLEAGAGVMELAELDFSLPPAVAGRALRSVKTAVAGAPAAATIKRTGDAVRVIWMRPVRVEPGRPLTLDISL